MIYELKNKEMPWGDYGDILLEGMTGHLKRQEGFLQLERTGPFIPDLIISQGNIIITDSTKNKLVDSDLKGLHFKPVIKKRIVQLDWINWDFSAEDPFFYPETGEPENYILDQPHSEIIAEKLGQVWELVVEESGVYNNKKLFLDRIDFDIFRPKNTGHILATEAAKDWLISNVGQWIRLDSIEVQL